MFFQYNIVFTGGFLCPVIYKFRNQCLHEALSMRIHIKQNDKSIQILCEEGKSKKNFGLMNI